MEEMSEGKFVDELIELRASFRQLKEWQKCDEIRNYLDTKNVFVYDTATGQEVYFMPYNFCGGRAYLEKMIKREVVAEKNFDSWLYSINSKIKNFIKKK